MRKWDRKKYIRMKKEERFLLFIYSRISKSGLELKNILRESIRAESLQGEKKKTRNRRGGGDDEAEWYRHRIYFKRNSGKNPIRNGKTSDQETWRKLVGGRRIRKSVKLKRDLVKDWLAAEYMKLKGRPCQKRMSAEEVWT
jgi:hypothetical protein